MSRSGGRGAANDAGSAETDPRERVDRTRTRSWALQVLYRWDGSSADRSLEEALEDTLRTRRVAERRVPLLRAHVHRVQEYLPEVDAALKRALDNWRLERLSRVDRSVLRLAAAELLFAPEVPPRVALQEGIRLAGQYGGSESSRFVNGVLDAVYRESHS